MIITWIPNHQSFVRQNPNPSMQNGSAAEERKGNVTYGIDDNPPWYLCIFLALQVH